MPGYVEFRIGDQETELGSSTPAMPRTEAAALDHQPAIERGHGFVTASVVDPFGNILGVMTNAHHLEVLGGQSAG